MNEGIESPAGDNDLALGADTLTSPGESRLGPPRVSGVQFTKSLIPRQNRRSAQPARSSASDAVGPLTGCHVLLVVERTAQDSGVPAPADVIAGLRSHGVRVGVLDCYSTIADLVGHRITGRPDLVIGMLPGRGPALAAIRAAQRLDAPLMALVSHDGPPSWGESSTLRRAVRVVIAGEELRTRVQQCGVEPDRIDVWHSFTPGAMRVLEQLAEHTITQHRRATGAAGDASDPGELSLLRQRFSSEEEVF